jgi:tyrosyl-DNA phosphodiesterase 1
MDHDWRDIENTVWVQDVPYRSSPIPHDAKADDFPVTLERVLYAVNVAPALATLASTDVGFYCMYLPLSYMPYLVHSSIPTSRFLLCAQVHFAHAGTSPACAQFSSQALRGSTRAGLRSSRRDTLPLCVLLASSTRRNGPSRLNTRFVHSPGSGTGQHRPPHGLQQGSSIGTYSAAWLTEFVLSARGASPEAWLNSPKSRRVGTSPPSPDTLKILFPTRDWVRSSVLGEAGGGTMFCRKNTWEAAKFPRNLFHESRSRRGRVLMHSKVRGAPIIRHGIKGLIQWNR